MVPTSLSSQDWSIMFETSAASIAFRRNWTERSVWTIPPLFAFLTPGDNIIIIIIIIIIIAFKGAIRNLKKKKKSPHCAANCLQDVRSSGPGAFVCKSRARHRALITCDMSCHVPRGTKGQLSY